MSITLIIGPMFCGKTTELTRLIDRETVADKRCVIIRHINDTRYDKIMDNTNLQLVTHSGNKYSGCDIIRLANLDSSSVVKQLIDTYDVVGVDEGFFFKGINKFCNHLANNGKNVIVSTIDSSFKQEPFDEISNLIANAESVIKLTAICMRCKLSSAAFTIRISDSDETIIVGGKDIYQCVCRKCLILFNKNKY